MKTKLSDIRKAFGMTQEQLGTAIGTTGRVISTWERNETALSLEDACKIADVFRCTLDDLAGRKRASLRAFANPMQETLNNAFDTLSPAGQKRLLEHADLLVSSGQFEKGFENQGNTISKSA